MGFYPNRNEVVLLLQLLFILGLGETKVCIIKQQPDPTDNFHLRWVLPYAKEILCTCTKVEYQKCTGKYHITMPLAKEYFYTDDPKPFIESESPEKLRMLLECAEATGKFPDGKNLAYWGDWPNWDTCSSTCGNGTQSRVAQCVIPETTSISCVGKQPMQTRFCNNGRCPVWGEWGAWGSCSASCGDGTMSRVNDCVNTDFIDVACVGEQSSESQNCNNGGCPVWGEWSEWAASVNCNSCITTCGNETRGRVKLCQKPDFPNSLCDGEQPIQSLDCSQNQCWGTNGSFCYYARAHTLIANADAARNACLRQNATLTSVGSREEQDFLTEFVRDFPFSWFWIGLNDKTTEGNWEWDDGTQFGFENWAGGNPDDGGIGNNEDCVHFYPPDGGDRFWNDIPCTENMVSGYVCKRKQLGTP